MLNLSLAYSGSDDKIWYYTLGLCVSLWSYPQEFFSLFLSPAFTVKAHLDVKAGGGAGDTEETYSIYNSKQMARIWVQNENTDSYIWPWPAVCFTTICGRFNI